MKLTVFAATGRIGGLVVDRALAAGHDVTAVARDTRRVRDGVRAVQADLTVTDPDALIGAVAGADAVISGLGPRKRADSGVVTPGTRPIVAAMEAAGVARLVVVSAAPIAPLPTPDRPHPPRHDPGDGFVMRYLGAPMARAMLRVHYADLAEMEALLRASALDWTSVRPPRLTDGPATGTYRVAYGRNVRGGASVSRADVADLMLATLDDPRSVRQTLGVAR
jgi:putative NADH-flavin reductase